MVDYKNKDKWAKDTRKAEVVFTNYSVEFSRFYNEHKDLCDSISGIKENVFGEERFYIDKYNFQLAINKARAFIITYDYALSNDTQRNEVSTKLKELELLFVNDENYKRLTSKKGNLSFTQEVELNKMYLTYLFKVFDIIHLMSKYLQSSLNISSREIIKSVNFVDYDAFFNHFSHYRSENSRNIANLRYEDLYDNYKKVIGFFYTYRYLIRNYMAESIENVLMGLFDELTSNDTTKNIIRIKEGNISDNQKTILIDEFLVYKDIVGIIYRQIYNELQGKNILPKNVVDILEDNTLI